jgi:outer membrane protein TolC
MRTLLVPVLGAALLGGCAGHYADRGFEEVTAATRDRLGPQAALVWQRGEAETAEIKTRVDALLAKPLDVDAAVALALINNHGLQADFAELGIAAADMMQAVLPRSPGFSYKRDSGGGEVEIERGVTLDLAGILTLPFRAWGESHRHDAVKRRIAGLVLALAMETRRAYVNAVAAEQLARYREDATEAAEAAAELSTRLRGIGNLPQIDDARARAFHLETTAEFARARATSVAARERLIRLLGLWDAEHDIKLPDRLPELPPAPRQHDDAETIAIANRADLKMARADLEATAKALGLTRITRLVGAVSLTFDQHRQTGEQRRTGYEIDVSVPIFDFGDSRVARAEYLYMRAVHRVAETAINARSEVREAYLGYRTAYDVARRYRDEIVPLRKTISEEMLLRYNGMLVSVFELLADAREQIAGITAAIIAQRDFWLADGALETALYGLGGAPTSPSGEISKSAAPAAGAH